MRPHTHTKPKPMLPIAGKPNIDHILDLLEDLDVSEYIFITGHLKEYVEEYVKAKGLPARFIEQKVKDGTAGAIRLAKEYVDEPVLIIFVDTVFEADLGVIATSEDDGIIWAQEVEDYQRFGVIIHDDERHMQKIVEKPNEPVSKLANIGVYYIRNYKLMFEGIEHVYEQNITLKGEYYLTDAFQYMIDNGAKIKVLEVDGWYDCGKPETTLDSNAQLLQKYHELRSEPKESNIVEPVFIDEGCTIEGSTIGPNVSISKGCTIKNAELRDCIVDANSTIENVALHESIIGEETIIEGSGTERQVSLRVGDHSHTKL